MSCYARFRARLQTAQRAVVRWTRNFINTSFKILFGVMVAVEIALGLMFALLGAIGPTLKDKPTNEGSGYPPRDEAGIRSYEVAMEVAFFLTGLVGIGMIFVGALGAVAVFRQQVIVTKAFCVILLCCSVILCCLAVVALVGSTRRGPAFKAHWRPQMKNYTFDPEFFVGGVDGMQNRLKCCGLSGEEVYSVYPWSCCGTMQQAQCEKNNTNFHETPCDLAGFQKYLAATKALGSLALLTAIYLIVIVLIVWAIRFKEAAKNEQDVELSQSQIEEIYHDADETKERVKSPESGPSTSSKPKKKTRPPAEKPKQRH